MALTALSATVKDSDGQLWSRGSWKLDFIPTPSNPNLAQYLVDGTTPLSPTVISQHGSMDNNGFFSLSLYDNTTITPVGSSWKLTICPLSAAPCGFYNFSAAGASLDISSALTFLLSPPRFLGVYPSYGYADGEVVISNKPGSTYYNVIQQAQRYYNDQTQTWAIVGTGPAGTPGVPGPPGNPSTILTGQQDPNTITTQGIYYLPDGMGGPNIPNPPHIWDSRGGVLEVFYYLTTGVGGSSPTYCFQRYQTFNDFSLMPGEFFIRWYGYFNDGTGNYVMMWGPWSNEIAPSTYVTAAGTDLNTYTNQGIFYIPQGTGPNTPSTLSNSDMCILEVFVYTGSLQHPYTLQRLSASQNNFLAVGSGGGERYERWYWWNGTANVWGPWYRFAPVGTA